MPSNAAAGRLSSDDYLSSPSPTQGKASKNKITVIADVHLPTLELNKDKVVDVCNKSMTFICGNNNKPDEQLTVDAINSNNYEPNNHTLSTHSHKTNLNGVAPASKPGPKCSKRKQPTLSLVSKKRTRSISAAELMESANPSVEPFIKHSRAVPVSSTPSKATREVMDIFEVAEDMPCRQIDAQSVTETPITMASVQEDSLAPCQTIQGKNQQPLTDHGDAPVPEEKIPAIFLHNISSIQPLVESLNTIEGLRNKYSLTCLKGNRIKLLCKDLLSYQQVLAKLEAEKCQTHTFQRRSERGYRVVIRQIHHSTPCDQIRRQLTGMGFSVRYISNIKHRRSRKPLDLFEVELAPAADHGNDKVLSITRLGNQVVKVERQLRRLEPAMCHRCQKYEHTKANCRRDFVCMKCAGPHATTDCSEVRVPNPKCANCGLGHVASYKGCVEYKKAQARLLAHRAHVAVDTVPQNNNMEHRRRETLRVNSGGTRTYPVESPRVRNPLHCTPSKATYSQILKKNLQRTVPTENPAENHLKVFQARLQAEQGSLRENPFSTRPKNFSPGRKNSARSPPTTSGNQLRGQQPHQEPKSLKETCSSPGSPSLTTEEMLQLVQQNMIAVSEMGKKVDALFKLVNLLIASSNGQINVNEICHA
ncbi:uncharacterized protein LOC121467349 [Drosophila elegans]|uniref:uncharacterized protein LOC121467349 n=1 Tax=Drosophila elegans TaxID=30023 RepID=UPI001BC86042|nr:uncharacterized protein LOC121467349 [Drosophila elegans]